MSYKLALNETWLQQPYLTSPIYHQSQLLLATHFGLPILGLPVAVRLGGEARPHQAAILARGDVARDDVLKHIVLCYSVV